METIEVEQNRTAGASLSDLPVVTPDEMGEHGFPYNVPTELTEAQGNEVERIIARGAPDWVRKLRESSGR